ncbi:hypothetical protein ABK040_010008 [Willaertia magna]
MVTNVDLKTQETLKEIEKLCLACTNAIGKNNLKLAFEHISNAEQLIPPGAWTDMVFYNVALNVNVLLAECEFYSRNYDKSIEIYESLLTRIPDPIDKLKVRYLLLRSCSICSRYEQIYDEYVALLANNPSTHCLVANGDSFTEKWIENTTINIKEILTGFSTFEEILELKPCLQEDETLHFARCILECIQGIYLGRNANKIYLFVTPLLVSKLMFDEGLLPILSHLILTSLGWQLAYLDEPAIGCKLAEIGIRIGNEHCPTETSFALSKFLNVCVTACENPLYEVIKEAEDAFRTATQLEEISWASQSGMWYVISSVFLGINKEKHYDTMEEVKAFCRKYSRNNELDAISCLDQLHYFLEGTVENFTPALSSEESEEIPFTRFIFFLCKLIVHYLRGELKLANQYVLESDDVADDAFGTPLYMIYKWFSLLVLTSLYENADSLSKEEGNNKKKQFSIMDAMLGPNTKTPKTLKEKTLERIYEHEKDIMELYTKYPVFMDASMALCKAEMAKLNSQDSLHVIQLYTNAVNIASKQDLSFYASIIQSRLTSFCCQMNCDSRTIGNYAQDAVNLWNSFGANHMATTLTEKYHIYISQIPPQLPITKRDSRLRQNSTSSLYSLVPIGAIDLTPVFLNLSDKLIQTSGASRCCIILKQAESNEFKLILERFSDAEENELLEETSLINASNKISVPLSSKAIRTRTSVLVCLDHDSTLTRDKASEECEYLRTNSKVKELLITPIIAQLSVRGIVYLESDSVGVFSQQKVTMTSTIVEVAVESTKLLIDEYKIHQRFSPVDLLKQLGRDITKIEIGDTISKRMTILHTNIRDLSGLLEDLSVTDTFGFVNSYLKHIMPIIDIYGGIIERSSASNLSALFPNSIDDSIKTSLEILNELRDFNQEIVEKGFKDYVTIGISINYGTLVLGVIGNDECMSTTIISEAYDLGACITPLTKQLGVSIVATKEVIDKCSFDKLGADYRRLGKFSFNNSAITLYEIFDKSWPEYSDESSMQISKEIDNCINLFNEKKFIEVMGILSRVESEISQDDFNQSMFGANPHYSLVQLYKRMSSLYLNNPSLLPPKWNGEILVDKEGIPLPFECKEIFDEDTSLTIPKVEETTKILLNEYEQKANHLMLQVEKLKLENENLRKTIDNFSNEEYTESAGCFGCFGAKKRVHPQHMK